MPNEFQVSVIIPAFNAEAFLGEALESVFCQTRRVHEIIVVDDGSSDGTAQVVERFDRQKVSYLRQANKGVSAARNLGIDRATGNWLAFLDADDVWLPRKIERVEPVCLGTSQPALVFSDYYTFGEEEALHCPSQSLLNWDRSQDILVPLISVMPSASFVKNGTAIRFPEWAHNDEDAIFFNMTSRMGPVTAVNEPLIRYRKHSGQAQTKVTALPTGCLNLASMGFSKRNCRHLGRLSACFILWPH